MPSVFPDRPVDRTPAVASKRTTSNVQLRPFRRTRYYPSHRMSLSNWIQFRWDLTQLPQFDSELPEGYEIGPATAEDEVELRKVISSSFVLDPAWNPSTQEVMETIEPWLERAFASPTQHLPRVAAWRANHRRGDHFSRS